MACSRREMRCVPLLSEIVTCVLGRRDAICDELSYTTRRDEDDVPAGSVTRRAITPRRSTREETSVGAFTRVTRTVAVEGSDTWLWVSEAVTLYRYAPGVLARDVSTNEVLLVVPMVVPLRRSV